MIDFILSIDKKKNGKYSVLFKDEKKPALLCEKTIDVLLMMIDKIQEIEQEKNQIKQMEESQRDAKTKTQTE